MLSRMQYLNNTTVYVYGQPFTYGGALRAVIVVAGTIRIELTDGSSRKNSKQLLSNKQEIVTTNKPEQTVFIIALMWEGQLLVNNDCCVVSQAAYGGSNLIPGSVVLEINLTFHNFIEILSLVMRFCNSKNQLTCIWG